MKGLKQEGTVFNILLQLSTRVLVTSADSDTTVLAR